MLGVPLGTALGQWLGWRVALGVLAAASAVYVVAFQVGIGGGALLGERFVSSGLLGWLPALAAVLTLGAGLIVLVARRAFPTEVPQQSPATASI